MEIVTAPFAQWSGVERRPLVLAGPAAAESAEQLEECARRLSGLRVDYLATVVDRREAGGEEASAERALAWLRDAGARHRLRTATAVTTGAQAERALALGVDLLWIEGEAVADQAAMKDLAHALRGAAAPVLVGSPPHADLAPWLESFERLAAAGVSALGALHCGFPAAGAALSREALGWEAVIEIRRLLPALPVVAQVSRLAGRRDRLREVGQSALDLGLHGLFLEAHPDPDRAWSAADRQVTPERVGAVLAELVVRRPESTAAEFNRALAASRGEIDRLDRALLELLAQRMRVVDRIAGSKRASNVSPLQVERWRAMVEERLRWAAASGVEPELARAVFAAVHGEAVRRQGALLDAAPPPPAEDGERDES